MTIAKDAMFERADEVRVDVIVRASLDRAFEFFTERGHDWWPPHICLGDAERVDLVLEPRMGGRWYERTADGKECDWGTVLIWDPPNKLALSWQIGVGFIPEPNPQRASRVEVTFEQVAPNETLVSLVHTDFEKHGPGWESMRDGVAHENGWPGILNSLVTFVRS